MKHTLLIPAAGCLLTATSVFAQAPSVAIVAAASASITDCRYTDVQSYLLATGSFSGVDVLDCTTQTPTLADLTAYDTVLTWTNVNYFDRDVLGDTMADYVDTGRGVVVAVFGNTSTGAARSLGGRWATGGYEVIQQALGNTSGSSSIGAILDPTHPMIQGVTNLSATSAFRPLVGTGLVQGTVIAEWTDGSILAAAGTMPNRADLGMYPPSNNCSGAFWDFTGDGDILVANALLHVSGGGTGPGTNYCMPNVNSTGMAGAMGASGSPSAAANSLTLEATQLPASSFAFFITSQTQGFVANPGGSSGNLCLAGAVGRYVGPGQVQQANGAGMISLGIDLTMTPQPMGFVSVAAGETWNYQAWFRDAMGGVPTSNFTDGYSITFN